MKERNSQQRTTIHTEIDNRIQNTAIDSGQSCTPAKSESPRLGLIVPEIAYSGDCCCCLPASGKRSTVCSRYLSGVQ